MFLGEGHKSLTLLLVLAILIILLTVTVGNMMATAKPGQKISIDKLQTTLVELERLAEKPKEELSLRESIYFLRDKLRNALKKGYSYQDLSELLEQQEILISAATLKQYLTEIEKGANKEKRGAKSVKAKQPSPEAKSPEQAKDIPKTSDKESSEKPKADLPELALDIVEANVAETRKSSQESDNQDGVDHQGKTSRGVKRNPKGASKSTLDLSSDFNQY